VDTLGLHDTAGERLTLRDLEMRVDRDDAVA
jgi:hypothetical protein